MQRRSGSGQPAEGRRGGRKARKASTAHVSASDLHEDLDLRTRERDEALGIISPGIIFSAIVRISADGHGDMADGHGGMATTIGRPMHTAITRHPRSQSHLNENHPAQRASIVSKLSRFRQKMAEQQRLGFYAARKGRMRLSPHYRYSRETVLSIVGGAELYCELAK